MKKLRLLPFLILALIACDKEKEQSPSITFNAESGGVYISNEGNFQASNSSINYYYPSSGASAGNVFEYVNKRPLGDICQSMNVIDGKIYLVVNNSGKIEVCETLSMKNTATISGLTSPRYIVQAGPAKAYVSDAYAGNISIIDLMANTVSGTIVFPGWSEQMLLKNGNVYVASPESEYLYMIDANTDAIADSILIGKGASALAEDKDGKLWVICWADYLGTYDGSLFRINPISRQSEMHLSFASGVNPSRLCMNPAGDTLYYLNSGVFRMSIYDTSLPSAPFVASNSNNYYALGVDPNRNEVYVSDAIDYIQRGKVIRYDAAGNELTNFIVGKIPGEFLFIP